MAERFIETWTVRKPVVDGAGGVVASQHHAASEIGAAVLRDGGNAVDAALATGFAVATLEPWMSGIGGGGSMLVHLAKTGETWCVEFGMVSPRRLDPASYPLVAGADSDLFGWPSVEDDRNVRGFPSISVPGYVAGAAAALERFGTRSWADTLGPAIALAEQGMAVDWYATLMVATGAADLARHDESARIFLPGGFPPVGDWAGVLPRLKLGRLAETLKRLASAGARDFYEGEIARALVADLEAGGNRIVSNDLASYRARIAPAETRAYRDAKVTAAPGLTAGPTLHRTFELLKDSLAALSAPDAAAYAAYARALLTAYEERFARMGDADETKSPSCTTHVSVADKDGNLVALTQTLLSLFGSKVVLPRTGVLMNNGVMWFDPRPGRPNSIGPGKRPLSNMCPIVVERADGFRYAMGASGGRRIMPALMQLTSFQCDYGMSLEEAFHTPRIDVSGTDLVTLDDRLPASVQQAMAKEFRTLVGPHAVYPKLFACPNAAGRDPRSGRASGAAFLMSPWSGAAAA
jgi:gamma-glutamyltranspeptidase/glutathione hydrolase